MTVAIADTTVLVHLYRRYAPSLTWYGSLSQPLGITPITWMEIIVGAANARAQEDSLRLLSEFELVYLSQADQDWAMQQLAHLRLSHGAGMNDCLIASAAHRLQVPLYTHNLKDMIPLLGDELALRPYS